MIEPSLIGLWNSREGIFGSDLRQFERRLHHPVDGLRAKSRWSRYSRRAVRKNTRTPMDLDPASLRVSTCPRRTTVENSSPSRTTASAAVAPLAIARRHDVCAPGILRIGFDVSGLAFLQLLALIKLFTTMARGLFQRLLQHCSS